MLEDSDVNEGVAIGGISTTFVAISGRVARINGLASECSDATGLVSGCVILLARWRGAVAHPDKARIENINSRLRNKVGAQ